MVVYRCQRGTCQDVVAAAEAIGQGRVDVRVPRNGAVARAWHLPLWLSYRSKGHQLSTFNAQVQSTRHQVLGNTYATARGRAMSLPRPLPRCESSCLPYARLDRCSADPPNEFRFGDEFGALRNRGVMRSLAPSTRCFRSVRRVVPTSVAAARQDRISGANGNQLSESAMHEQYEPAMWCSKTQGIEAGVRVEQVTAKGESLTVTRRTASG